jgi:hypothetical protein
MSRPHKTIVGDIAGGTKPIERDMGDNLTIEHIWSMIRWYPGYEDLINLETDAIFSNGFNEPEAVDLSRQMEAKMGVWWSLAVGYSALVVDARDAENRRIEFWHPYISGIGFQFTGFSNKGHPTTIQVYTNPNETKAGGGYEIPHYPCKKDTDGEYITDQPEEGGYGFFPLRNQGSIKGVQGMPEFMALVDPIKLQWDIMKAYGPYAVKQGMAFPVVGLENNNPTNRTNVKSQFANQPTTNRLLIIGNEDAVEWISPQAGAYDPYAMLQWLNSLIARRTQMNLLMLEGVSEGQLSSSETAITNWHRKRAEDQSYWLTQLKGALIALGASEDVNFQDPVKPSFVSLMAGMKDMREAWDGLVAKQDIVDFFNVYLEKNDQNMKLHVAEEGEWETQMEGDDRDGNPGSADNKGD